MHWISKDSPKDVSKNLVYLLEDIDIQPKSLVQKYLKVFLHCQYATNFN